MLLEHKCVPSWELGRYGQFSSLEISEKEEKNIPLNIENIKIYRQNHGKVLGVFYIQDGDEEEKEKKYL